MAHVTSEISHFVVEKATTIFSSCWSLSDIVFKSIGYETYGTGTLRALCVENETNA